MNENLINALKEGARVFLMAVVPLVIIELENGGLFDVRAILIAGVIAILRFVDKVLYLTQKDNTTAKNLESGWKGLTGF